jgi:putative GTP pyrophosphokinase
MTDNGEFYGVHYYEELTDACDKVDADIHAYMEKTGKNDDLKPIVYCTHRIKSPSSLRQKLAKRGLPQTYESALENGIHDIVGFRIVCAFQEDVYATKATLFDDNPDYEIVNVKDYVKYTRLKSCASFGGKHNR